MRKTTTLRSLSDLVVNDDSWIWQDDLITFPNANHERTDMLHDLASEISDDVEEVWTDDDWALLCTR